VKNAKSAVALLLALGNVLVMPPKSTAANEGTRPAQQPPDGVRVVVAAVVRVAEANARLPLRTERGGRETVRLDGDDLTERYVRAAAEAARKLPAEQTTSAFLLGIGIALDDSMILRKNPLTRALCRRAESDAERTQRLAVLGSPTMRGRRDLAQHFVVSCALVEVVGESLAEAAGLFKEQQDAQPGGSGFSFADLNADLSGVALATRLKKGKLSLERLEKQYHVADYLPDHARLREGLSAAQFARDYGDVNDRRFRVELERLRKGIAALYK